MNLCKDCKHRDDAGYCGNNNLQEGTYYQDTEAAKAMLLYSYDEGGSFWVGPDFGCVHWEDKDPTPWCIGCGAMKKKDCHCGPLADND
jgi:hypothetical protein